MYHNACVIVFVRVKTIIEVPGKHIPLQVGSSAELVDLDIYRFLGAVPMRTRSTSRISSTLALPWLLRRKGSARSEHNALMMARMCRAANDSVNDQLIS